jgi:hypothetical protein
MGVRHFRPLPLGCFHLSSTQKNGGHSIIEFFSSPLGIKGLPSPKAIAVLSEHFAPVKSVRAQNGNISGDDFMVVGTTLSWEAAFHIGRNRKSRQKPAERKHWYSNYRDGRPSAAMFAVSSTVDHRASLFSTASAPLRAARSLMAPVPGTETQS